MCLKKIAEVLIDGEIKRIQLSDHTNPKKESKRDILILNTTHSFVSLVTLAQKVARTAYYSPDTDSLYSRTPQSECQLLRPLRNNKGRPARDKKA